MDRDVGQPQRDRLRELVSGLRTWKRGERRAPHKPLLLLFALGRVQRGEPRLVEFAESEKPLRELLERFGHPTGRQQPLYPFWRLTNDGLWELRNADGLPLRSGDKEPRITAVRDGRMEGGFPPDIHALLAREPALVAQLASQILNDHFPPTMHDEILDAVGLDATRCVPATSRTRDRRFRESVLRAYEHRCAICGFQALLEGTVIGVEAAHVRWHAYDGPEVVDNGLALCILHHKLLDLGAVGISEDRSVLVSAGITGDEETESRVIAHSGRRLRAPQAGFSALAAAHTDWHRREVFRHPARVAV